MGLVLGGQRVCDGGDNEQPDLNNHEGLFFLFFREQTTVDGDGEAAQEG